MHLTLVGALRSLNSIQERSDFYRSWETALRTTKDVGQSLATMMESPNPQLSEAQNFLLDGIGKGRPVGVTCKLRPDLFPAIDQAFIATGDGFGTLHDSLRLLSEFYLREFTRMTRIRGWVGVPLFLAVVGAFVLPLPLLFDANRWAYSIAIIVGVIAIYALGGIPVSLLYSTGRSSNRVRRPRFAWTLAMSLEAGLTFAAAARLAATVAEMHDITKQLDAIPQKDVKTISAGANPLSTLLQRSTLWPAMKDQIKKADEAFEYLSTLRVFAEHLESPP